MLAKEGVLDLQAFYRRAVQHLWNTLRLQEARDILKEGNAALVRQVSVRITQDNLEALDDYLKSKADPHKVDEFLQQGFTLETPPSESSPSLLQSAVTLGHAVIHAGKSLEVWLCMLCGGFVVLAMWAVVLFVRDIQRELRWGCVLGMMATVVFFICCLWHWRHMYKMAESRRHAELAKRGYTGIPEECQPGARSSAGNVYDWVKVNLFGSPDVCEKYFEQLMIDAIEEITPGMVIAETVSRFLFQPLQHLGTESGKLTTNFYKNVPPAYHLHATALFLGLLVVVLFYGCAYGIDFPLGLGGYRPMARQESTWGRDRAGLGREAVEQLNRDREKFLEESRRMLTDIAKAAEGTKVPQQQLVVTSSGILEVQLERLISRHLDRAMEQQGGVPASPGVHTITSTPLRPQGTTKAVVQQSSPEQQSPEQQSPGLLSDFSSSSSSSSSSYSSKGQQGPVVVNERGDFQAMLASTDAVHRRVAGTPAVRCLPPRTSSRSSSTNTSAASTPTASEAGSPSARRKKGSKFLRMFRSAEVPPSPKPSPSASTQSLSHGDLDEPDLGAPPDNSSFLAEVRSVLDLSTNSEHPSPPSSPSPPSQDWSTEDRQVSVSSPPP
ncbi:chloride channel CLIC-like protein 1 isoform X2 [Scylla paramamosain]